MKNIFFIAIALTISVSTASAAEASYSTENYILKKRAEAEMLKASSQKKVARYQHLIDGKQTLITGIRVNALPKVSDLETASGSSSPAMHIPSGK